MSRRKHNWSNHFDVLSVHRFLPFILLQFSFPFSLMSQKYLFYIHNFYKNPISISKSHTNLYDIRRRFLHNWSSANGTIIVDITWTILAYAHVAARQQDDLACICIANYTYLIFPKIPISHSLSSLFTRRFQQPSQLICCSLLLSTSPVSSRRHSCD